MCDCVLMRVLHTSECTLAYKSCKFPQCSHANSVLFRLFNAYLSCIFLVCFAFSFPFATLMHFKLLSCAQLLSIFYFICTYKHIHTHIHVLYGISLVILLLTPESMHYNCRSLPGKHILQRFISTSRYKSMHIYIAMHTLLLKLLEYRIRWRPKFICFHLSLIFFFCGTRFARNLVLRGIKVAYTHAFTNLHAISKGLIYM